MNEDSVFAGALAITSPRERAAYLDRVCEGNETLRREVEALLDAHQADNVLDRLCVNVAATGEYRSPVGTAVASVGDRVGPYRLMELIGEGGFGLVFVADQAEPVRRKVALKILKPGMDTRDIVARFEAERQALAMMDHPNIARVLDAGSTSNGRPFFVMELVRGVPITEFCDQHKLAPKDRLNLFMQVCQAVQHAHQKGVIHRDIKPSNVLVTMIDGRPVPKVIDFGIAKAVGASLTERTIYTRFTQVLGTPLYMSPEQAEMSGVDVDTRADVYALGVLLYELLTGTTPFDRDRFRTAALDEIRRILREEEPPRPSTRLSSLGSTLTDISAQRGTEPGKLAGLVRGELDWVVMKCLEKDRNRRYETANALARDVERYLEGDAVEACPPTIRYRLWKVYRRHRAAVSVVALILGLTYAGACGVYFAYRRAVDAERRLGVERDAALVSEARAVDATRAAEAERDNAARANATLRQISERQRRTLYASEMNLAQKAWESSDARRTLELLRHWIPKPGEDDLRGFEWHYWNRQAHQEKRIVPLAGLTADDRAVGVVGAFSHDGTRVAAAVTNRDRTSWNLGVWDATSGRELWRSPAVAGMVESCVFSENGRRLLSWNSLFGSTEYKVEALVWDVGDGRLVYRSAPLPPPSVNGASLSGDGERLATDVRVGNGNSPQMTAVRTIRVSDGQEIARTRVEPENEANFVHSLISDPDSGSVLLFEGAKDPDPAKRRLRLLDQRSGQQLWVMDLGGHETARGARLIAGGNRFLVRLSSRTSIERVVALNARDGRLISTYRLPEVPRVIRFGGSTMAVLNSRLAVMQNGRAVVFDLDRPNEGEDESSVSFNHDSEIMAIALVAAASRLLTLDSAGVVREWDLHPKPRLKRTILETGIAQVRRLATPKGSREVYYPSRVEQGSEGVPRIVDASGREVGDRLPSLPPGHSRYAAESADGQIKATLWLSSQGDRQLVAWDLAAGRERTRIPLGADRWNQVVLSPDGFRAALLGNPPESREYERVSKLAHVVNLKTGEVLWSSRAQSETRYFHSVAFDPSGRHMVFSRGSQRSDDWEIVWYDAASMTEKARLPIASRTLGVGCFSPDGSLVAVRQRFPDGQYHSSTALVFAVEPILRGESPDPLVRLMGTPYQFHQLEFSPDGKRLVASGEGRLKFWETNDWAEVLSLPVTPTDGSSILLYFHFSKDGRQIWAGLDESDHPWGWDATPFDEAKTP